MFYLNNTNCFSYAQRPTYAHHQGIPAAFVRNTAIKRPTQDFQKKITLKTAFLGLIIVQKLFPLAQW